MNMKNYTSNNPIDGGKPGPARFFDTPAPGQFHSLAAETDDWESFVLVLKIQKEGMYPECIVVPGSMDVRKGGPDDLLIKHPDYRECWFLDFSQVRSIRADALLPGFAVLSDEELSRIKHELMLYRREEESGTYRYGLPFIGENDSRRRYHADLGTLMETADKEAADRYWRRLASSFQIEPRRDDPSDRHSSFFDYLSKAAERGFSSSESRRSMFSTPSESKPGLMFCISDFSFLHEDEKKRRGPENVELSFTPEAGELQGGESGFITVEIRFEEEKIMAEAVCEANPGIFDGIQLRRCSDRFLIGTIRNGKMEASLVPELEKGIYFARPGDVPLSGKWEKR